LALTLPTFASCPYLTSIHPSEIESLTGILQSEAKGATGITIPATNLEGYNTIYVTNNAGSGSTTGTTNTTVVPESALNLTDVLFIGAVIYVNQNGEISANGPYNVVATNSIVQCIYISPSANNGNGATIVLQAPVATVVNVAQDNINFISPTHSLNLLGFPFLFRWEGAFPIPQNPTIEPSYMANPAYDVTYISQLENLLKNINDGSYKYITNTFDDNFAYLTKAKFKFTCSALSMYGNGIPVSENAFANGSSILETAKEQLTSLGEGAVAECPFTSMSFGGSLF
jgi:hypothetical protein